jgi:hypothetical protein
MILNGTELRVYLNETLVALARNNSLSISSDLIGVSGQGNGSFSEVLPSIINWSVTVDCLVDLTEGTGLPSLFELITERTSFRLKISTENEADTYYWVGMAYLSSLDIEAPNEDVTSLSGEIIGDGVLERIPYDQLNFAITEAGLIFNNLIRLSPNNVLLVNGQDTNEVAFIQNGRIKSTKSFASDVLAICSVGNNFLVTLDQSGSNNVLINDKGETLAVYTSTTAPTDRDVFAVYYGGAIYTSKATKYVVKYVDNVEDDVFDLGGADVLRQLAVNKHGVFVINNTDTSVQKIDLAGTVTTLVDVASTAYVALAADYNYLFIGATLTGTTLSILCYENTTLKWTYPIIGTYPECALYADKDRNVYICLSDSIRKIKNLAPQLGTYEVVETWTPEKVTPKDIVVSPTGAIILASGQTTSGVTYQY